LRLLLHLTAADSLTSPGSEGQIKLNDKNEIANYAGDLILLPKNFI